MPKYLGPAVTFEHEGKTYNPGQNIPVSKDDVQRLQARGHRFEDAPAQSAEPTVTGALAVVPEAEDTKKDDEK